MAFLTKTNAAAMAIGSLIMLGLCFCLVTSTPDTTRRLYQCNPETFEDSDPYRQSVDYILKDLQTVTANTPGHDLYDQTVYPYSPPAYGHGSCPRSLSDADCVTCISAAYKEIRGLCNGHIGARVYLKDCTIRYENYPFDEINPW